jgi:Fic family protein
VSRIGVIFGSPYEPNIVFIRLTHSKSTEFMAPHWIWQQPDWPNFNWQAERLTPLLRECVQAQGRLMGMASSVGSSLSAQSELDALLQNIVTSSAIEGEQLNVGSVRSSLARRLGLELVDGNNVSQRSEGLAQLMLDATQHFAEPLTLERLLDWHEWLFPEQEADLAARPIRVGALRGDDPMQVVSGRLDRPTVHFEAPPRQGLERQLDTFLTWFTASRNQAGLDPLLRAGIAHFWFVTLHPFDDGNGRLTRAITDLALAQGEDQAIRFYAMSASILEDRSGYYRVLETCQKAQLDITEWLEWFLQTLLRSLQQAMARIESVLGKARFWQAHRESELSSEQTKVLNRLLDGGERGFVDGISAAQYQAVAKVSKATATRHLAELLEKGCLIRLPGGGRSTRYQINYSDVSPH